jgi:HD-like signal output (HDOD) protein
MLSILLHKFYLTVYYFEQSLTQMSFIYCHLNFHANLLRPWRFPLSMISVVVTFHTFCFSLDDFALILIFCVVFCRLLFACSPFFYSSLYCIRKGQDYSYD